MTKNERKCEEKKTKNNQKKKEQKKEKKIEDGSQEDVEFRYERGDKMKMSRKIEIRSRRNKIFEEYKK